MRPLVESVARAVRGDSEERTQEPEVERAEVERAEVERAQAVKPVETEPSAVPPWGILPSEVPARVELLRGDSSAEIVKESWGAAVQMCIAVAVLGGAVLLQHDDIPLVWVVPIALLGGAATLAASYYRIGKRVKAEQRAGYTVWRRRAPDVPQIDARTGYVIRPVGAPELSKQQEAAALKRVREIGRFVARHPRTMRGPL
ncbi:hypothetical protein ASF06_03225 [Agreia sp. Leaf244]|nr:hypothetical protein ASF06_03225 [Agreia sp. Leaf244]